MILNGNSIINNDYNDFTGYSYYGDLAGRINHNG